MKRYSSVCVLILLCLLLLTGCSRTTVGYPPAHYRMIEWSCQIQTGRILYANFTATDGNIGETVFQYMEYQSVGEGWEEAKALVVGTDLTVKQYDRLLEDLQVWWTEPDYTSVSYRKSTASEQEDLLTQGDAYYVYSLRHRTFTLGDGALRGEPRFGQFNLLVRADSGEIKHTAYVFVQQ